MANFFAFYPPSSSGGSGSNASVGSNGITAPTSSTEVAGVNPSGNLQPLQTDAAGNLLVNINSETGAPFHVIVDSSALPTGASTAANQVTQEATLTSIQANQTNGTQVTTISGTVPLPTGAATAALQSDVQSAPGTPQTVALTVQGNASGIAIPVTEVTPNIVVTGTITSTQSVTITAPSLGTVGLQASGTWVGTLVVEATVDSTIWNSINLVAQPSGTIATSFSAPLDATINAAGFAAIRIRGATVSSGTATITLLGDASVSVVTLGNPIPNGANNIGSINNVTGTVSLPTGAATSALQTTGNTSLSTIATNTTGAALDSHLTNVQSAPGTSATTAVTIQGSATGVAMPISGTVTATIAGVSTAANQTTLGSQTTKINDGTNTVAVKAASTAAVAADPSAVVALSPNSPLPAGSNAIGSITNTSFAATQSTAANLNATVVGLGTAGIPSGGVVSIQGVASGTPIPVSGTITASNPSVGTTGTTAPTSATEIGIINGSGNLVGITQGQSLSATSLPVVTATDTSILPVATSPSNVIATPTANSMAALNATVQYSMDAGSKYFLSLTNGPGATTAWNGTVTFQSSTNGSTWTSLTAYPVASPAQSGATTTATSNGLWLVSAPNGVGSQTVFVRANMTAYTSGTVYFFVQSQATPGARVILPWTYTVTSATTLLGPIEASSFTEIDLQISAITTTVYTAQGTNDPTLTTWSGIPAISVGTQAASVATMPTALTYRIMPNGYKWIRIQCTTTGTVATIQGAVGTIGQQMLLTAFGNDIGATINSGTLTTVGTVTTVAAVTAVANSTTALPAAQVTDISAVAFTVTTTSAAFSPTAGCSYVFEHSLSVYTSGSCQVTIQESVDGVNEWHNVYSFPPLTGTAIYQVSPPLMFNGKSIRYVSSGPTSVLTHTVSRTQMSQTAELPYKSLIDGGSGNGGTINPTTSNSITGTLPCEGLNNYTLIVNQGAGGSAVTFNLQGTVDNVNWITLATVVGVVGGATPVAASYQGVSMVALRAIVVTGVASTTISSIYIGANIATGTMRPNTGILTDNSGTTSGTVSTSTQIMAANPARKYLLIQNTSSNTIWINFTTAAVANQPSIELLSGGSIVQETGFVSSEAVNVLSTVASQAYTAKQA